ncbi:MAG: DUF2306 domain-containing protein [Bacteroidia bacterium]
MAKSSIPTFGSARFLTTSTQLWFGVIVIGQFIFALYILGFYGVNGLAGDFERWNANAPHAYLEGDLLSNIFFGMHVALAAIVTIGGPLQLSKKLRAKLPRIHRISGRIYVFSAFLISFAGLYLAWVKGSVGGLVGAIFISINGLIIIVCAFQAIKKAISRQFGEHRKWAIRLFLAMSGVWFFRVFLMLWLTIYQAPVGFDPETFMGPTLNMLYVVCYILPLILAEVYFRAKKASENHILKSSVASFILLTTIGIAIGTFSATMGMWLPNL